MTSRYSILAAAILSVSSGLAGAEIIVGNDLNSSNGANSTINALFSANRGSNGGGDQSLQFGDQLQGSEQADVIIGGLGIDVLFGKGGNDVLIGGTEDFNPFNRDRAFGEQGDDIFIWTPGDGNDFFDGGDGSDTLIITLIGENQDADGNTAGAPFFSVSPPGTTGSGDFDGIYINPNTQLPVVDVLAGPGFCDILDRSSEGLDELNLDHLVQFTLRGPAGQLEQDLLADPSIDPDTRDTGLRISVHLKNTEYVVCASKDGSQVDVFDLHHNPIVKTSVSDLPETAYRLVTNTF
ncbi:hypothetical protein FT643_05020 [Ketobacter sp. MCCC 1A13808]|uniref:calcium-binding protein n=1 Tax=Ketobacter sp. MCCC 1A13808 TaxID=2602738 RepID=UPI000F0FAE64|nr:hypothetical protein [Ketobacter sp. MCCC 1A13808]MVF11501.1 hypothetical protein [Ketobacter sp. MCCC 1A13808]RLP53292.1 MAG: hypothetical protein D6160_16740 [Ketobacter sp.]